MTDNNNFKYNHASSPIFKFGQGPKTIIVLHGWGSSIKSWKTLLSNIPGDEFTTYFLELPGFGQSKHPNTSWTIHDYSSFVQAFINSIQPNKLYLVTHSFGGRIAIDLLCNNSIKVEKAILVASSGIKPKLNNFQKFTIKFSGLFKRLLDNKIFKPIFNILRIVVYKLHRSGDYLKVSGTMKQTFLNIIDKDLTSSLSKISTPVRLIWGENDSYTPLWMGNQMNQLIPNSDIVIIPEGKHGLHLQNPELLILNITSYFSD